MWIDWKIFRRTNQWIYCQGPKCIGTTDCIWDCCILGKIPRTIRSWQPAPSSQTNPWQLSQQQFLRRRQKTPSSLQLRGVCQIPFELRRKSSNAKTLIFRDPKWSPNIFSHRHFRATLDHLGLTGIRIRGPFILAVFFFKFWLFEKNSGHPVEFSG